MKVNDVRNMKVALTHAGKFHADDVFGAAFLKIINPKLEIIRSNVVPADFDGLVFDIAYFFKRNFKIIKKRHTLYF